MQQMQFYLLNIKTAIKTSLVVIYLQNQCGQDTMALLFFS